MKKFIIGVLVGCLLMMTTPVLADSILTKIDVVLNGVNVQLEGKDVEVNSILYNGSTYLPIRKVAELVGKDIEWNQETMTANIVGEKIVNIEVEYPTIISHGFQSNGPLTMYTVAFSDGFGVGLSIPKSVVPELHDSLECILLLVNVSNMADASTLTTPDIVGFNEITKDKYYPISFDDYGYGLPTKLYDGFKALDFFENFKLYEQGDKSIKGTIYYASFPFLDGVIYDDGVHKCTLYLFDNGNR